MMERAEADGEEREEVFPYPNMVVQQASTRSGRRPQSCFSASAIPVKLAGWPAAFSLLTRFVYPSHWPTHVSSTRQEIAS